METKAISSLYCHDFRENGFGLNLGGVGVSLMTIGKETPIGGSGKNDTSVTLYSGSVSAGILINPPSGGGSVAGINVGARFLRAETRFSVPIPFSNRNLTVGLEGDLGAIGARFGFQDGRFGIGKSKGVGGGVSFGLEERVCGCDG